jgi:hypothetical protein
MSNNSKVEVTTVIEGPPPPPPSGGVATGGGGAAAGSSSLPWMTLALLVLAAAMIGRYRFAGR